ncbi:MAG TPA: Nif3-like dinuclear metal center hexameric protein [Saprospiraceae bacterium]|nr:Nif3-like dinuclear metal center hexameric protein [Saprospiraceae bacterium]
MAKVRDVYDYLNQIAPFDLQESYDNAGLLIGNFDNTVSAVLVCLDSTPEVVTEAIERGANLIVAHHPIIFSGLKSITGSNYIEETIILAIKNNINIIAIHTNLDNILTNGVNEKIAQRLGLTNLKILSPLNDEGQLGAGIIGELSKSMTESQFINSLKKSMELKVVRHTKFIDRDIRKVAVCGGSGSFLLGNAMHQQADAFITADFKYHQFFDADGQLVIFDIGHYESEKYTIELLVDLIKNKFSNFATHYTKHITNPVFYN